MVYALDLVDAPITCHVWNADGTQLALCPNTSDLLIYSVNEKKFDLLFTLQQHTQVISGVDWDYKHNRIVTCSHDRNAYVWDFEGGAWKPRLVVLRLTRAATYVRWSPDGERFVVATGTKKMSVCAWEAKENWWVAVNIAHDKPTGLAAEWAPDSRHILLASTDRHCRYITIDEEDAKTVKKAGKGAKDKKALDFCLGKFGAQAWVNSCAISPAGTWACFAGHDSYLRFLTQAELTGGSMNKPGINIPGLPFLALQFISEKALIGAGFDCAPRLFVLKGEEWVDLGTVDLPEIRAAETTQQSGLAAKAAAFGGKTVKKTENLHQNVILGIRFHAQKRFFSTCANDGRIGIWPLDKIKSAFKEDLGI